MKVEEEIVFAENKSMDDYIIGKEIGKGAYATVHIGALRVSVEGLQVWRIEVDVPFASKRGLRKRATQNNGQISTDVLL